MVDADVLGQAHESGGDEGEDVIEEQAAFATEAVSEVAGKQTAEHAADREDGHSH